MSTTLQKIRVLLLGGDSVTCNRIEEVLNSSSQYSYALTHFDWKRKLPITPEASWFDVCLVSHHVDIINDIDLIRRVPTIIGSGIPIVFLSFEDDDEQKKQLFKHGVTECINIYDFTLPLFESAISKYTDENVTFYHNGSIDNAIINHSAGAIITFNDSLQIQIFNKAAESIFGYAAVEVIGKSLGRLLPDIQLIEEFLTFEKLSYIDNGQIFKMPIEFPALRKNGDSFVIEFLITDIETNNGTIYCGALRDLSLHKKVDAEIRLLGSVFELHSALLITDANGLIIRINNALSEITGYEQHEVIGKEIHFLLSKERNDDILDRMWYKIAIYSRWEGEVWGVRKNAQHYPQYLAVTALRDNDGTVTNCVANFHDITKRRLIQSRIEHFAHYDMLTDLPNRRFLLERLDQEIARASRENVHGGLLYFDLDNFKNVNDSNGHAAGDELLQQVAKRLLTHVRTEDVVSRLGGDEFVVLLAHLTQGSKQSYQFAKSISKKLQMALIKPFIIEGRNLHISASIGVSMFPNENETAKDILKNADAAMYKSKANIKDIIIVNRASQNDSGTAIATSQKLQTSNQDSEEWQ